MGAARGGSMTATRKRPPSDDENGDATEPQHLPGGRFITSGSVNDLTKNAEGTVLVRASDHDKLAQVLTSNHGVVRDANDEGLTIGGLTSDQVGTLAFDAGITVYELTPQRASLEEVFMDLTADAVEYGHQPEPAHGE